MNRRRWLLLIAGLLFAATVTAPGAAGHDEVRQGGTTGETFVTNKYIWTGDTTGYGQVEVRYHMDVQPGAQVRARWECAGSNGPTDSFDGGFAGYGTDVRGDTHNGAHRVLSNVDSYCAYHVWAISGGGFRITTATVLFWHSEFPGQGGGADPSATPGPGTSSGPSPTPSPSPSPGPGGCGTEETRIIDIAGVEYTFRVVIFCSETFTGVDRQWVNGTGCVDNYPNGRAWSGQVTVQSGEERLYERHTVGASTTMAPSGSGTHRLHAYNITAGGSQQPYPNPYDLLTNDLTNYTSATLGVAGLTVAAGQEWERRSDGDTCDPGPGVGTFTAVVTQSEWWLGPVLPGGMSAPWDEDDVTPEPSPSPSASATPSPSAPPPPPPSWYPQPPPPLPTPTVGPNLGGNEGYTDPSPPQPNGSGVGECDEDDGTYSKPGQAPLRPLADTSFPGSPNPLDYIPWVGNLIANIPVVIGNAGQTVMNGTVDWIIPGHCVLGIIETHQATLDGTPPFSYFAEIEAATAGTAGSASLGAIPVPGGSVALPMADLATAGAIVRPILAAIVWLIAATVILSAVMGTFGVKSTE